MLRLLIATVTGNNGERLKLEVIDGFGKYGVDNAIIVAPAGQAKAQVWAAPSTGDQVLAIIDDTRPDLVYCLGAIWPDGKAPTTTDPEHILLQAPSGVTLVATKDAKFIPRDDRLQSQLTAIESALDVLGAAVNAHTHASIGAPVAPPGSPPFEHGYSVGATATDKVKGV